MYSMYNKPNVFFVRPEVGCGAGGWQNSAVEAADRRLCSSPPLCVGVQVYESKLQELQKQVETISLVAETPDEEELEEEEEEEGAYWKKNKKLFGADAVLLRYVYPLRVIFLLFLSRAQSTGMYVSCFLFKPLERFI